MVLQIESRQAVQHSSLGLHRTHSVKPTLLQNIANIMPLLQELGSTPPPETQVASQQQMLRPPHE